MNPEPQNHHFELASQRLADHRANAVKFQRLAHTLEPELRLAGVTAADPNKAKALAVVALRNKNFGAVQSMIQGGTIKAGDLPDLRKRAKAGAR